MNSSITMDIIKNNPNFSWNWNGISTNPNITIDFIKENLDKDWNWNSLILKPNITIDVINKNQDLPWNIDLLILSFKPNITITTEDIIKYKDLNNFDYCILSHIISIDYLKENLDKNWDWSEVSYNPNITLDFIEENLDKDWDWNYLNESFTIDTIKKNLNLPWDWDLITYKYLDKNDDTLKNNPNLPWSSYVINRYNNTMDIIKNNNDLDYINYNIITIDIIKNNLEKNWDWEILTKKFTMDIIIQNPELKWDWHYINTVNDNKDITFDMIKNNPNLPFDLSCILDEPEIFCVEKELRNIAAIKIQKWWIKCYYNPKHFICKKRILREFNEFQNIKRIKI